MVTEFDDWSALLVKMSIRYSPVRSGEGKPTGEWWDATLTLNWDTLCCVAKNKDRWLDTDSLNVTVNSNHKAQVKLSAIMLQ